MKLYFLKKKNFADNIFNTAAKASFLSLVVCEAATNDYLCRQLLIFYQLIN